MNYFDFNRERVKIKWWWWLFLWAFPTYETDEFFPMRYKRFMGRIIILRSNAGGNK